MGRGAMSVTSWTFSRAVRLGTRLKNWKTKPTRSRRKSVRSRSDREPRSVSPTSTRPESGRSMPLTRLRSVDLPEPDGPRTATRSPADTDAEAPARTSWVRSPS